MSKKTRWRAPKVLIKDLSRWGCTGRFLARASASVPMRGAARCNQIYSSSIGRDDDLDAICVDVRTGMFAKGEPCSTILALVVSSWVLLAVLPLWPVLALLVGATAAPAAKGSAAGPAGRCRYRGEVTYDGASSFQALRPLPRSSWTSTDVIISGSGNGSGKGLTAVAAGTVTIGNSDVFAETKLEKDDVKNLVDHEVAVVGMGPVVSKNVKVDDLSLEQLKGIFSGTITNWKEVGGDDAIIVVLNRKAGSGTRATFEAAVFGSEANEFKGDAELDKSGDVQTQLSSTDNAISYLDFSHYDDSKFNAVKVEGVEPKSENVFDNKFPIWATEHMYCAKDADEATTAFLDFMLSDDVQKELVEQQGFIPVSEMKVVKDASGKVTEK